MRRGISFVLFIVLSLAPIHAFANSWSTDQKDFTRNALVEGATSPDDLSVQWTKEPTVVANSRFQMPVYQDGILYFSEESGPADLTKVWTVYAVSKKTGEELWRKSGEGWLRCSPSISGNLMIIPGKDLILLDPKSGVELWRKSAPGVYFYVHPIISGDKIFVAYRDSLYGGGLQSLNLVDGSQIWSKPLYLYDYNPLSIYRDNILLTTGSSSNFSYVRSYRMSDGGLNWTYQRDYNPNGPTIVDEERGIGLLSSAVNSVTAINLETGQKITGFGVGSYASRTILTGGMANFVSYQGGKTYFNACNYVSGGCLIHKEIADKQIHDPRITSVVVGERLYFPSIDGKLYEVNISDGSFKSYAVADPSVTLSSTVYADGAFIIADYFLKKLYVLGNGAEPISVESSVELDSPYKHDGEYHSYLGQLHSHYLPDVALWSKIFNGDPSPAFTENKYKEAGYDFVALTEHNQVVDDPGVGGILHLANSEEDTQTQGGNHILAVGIHDPIDETLGDQARINAVVDQGGVPILAHPNSHRYNWSVRSLLTLSKYSVLELYNKGV